MSTLSSRDNFTAYTGYDSDAFITPPDRKKESSGKESPIKGTSFKDTLTGQVIMTKEGEDTINLEDLRAKLAHLRDYSNVPIRKLSGKLKADFESLAQYVAWMYNTDSYPSLYAEIKNYFTDTDIYQPGTVGAYCGGCLVKRKDGLTARGCTVICAGSIPPPFEDPEWDFCSDLVIWAVYNGDSYDFTTLNEIEDEEDDKAIVFVDQSRFSGFSTNEIKTLRDHGVNHVRIMYYNPQQDPVYQDMSGGYISLNEITIRDRQDNNPDTATTATVNGFNWWSLLIVLLILGIIFFLICRCF